jgi:hypothetical protein
MVVTHIPGGEMYIEAELDTASSISGGVTHYGPILPLGGFYGFTIHLSASALPAGTTYTIQLSGRKEKPTLDAHWVDIDTGIFVTINSPIAIEKETLFSWARYKVVNISGSSIDDFYGVISGKGQR